MLVQDVVDLGNLENIGRTFLHAAIDPSCCLVFGVLAGSTDHHVAMSVLNDQALAFYRKEEIAVLSLLAGPGMVSGADTDPDYGKFLKSQGITLSLPPAGDQPRNGFIERFERLVRKDFLNGALRSQEYRDLDALQSSFEDWLEGFNRETPLPGYPTMGRAPLEAFRAAAALKAPQEKTEDRPTPEPEPEPAPVSLPSAVAAAPSPPAPRAHEQHEWKPGREIWGFRAINAALIGLLIYFGWIAASMLLDHSQPEEDLSSAATVQPAPGSGAEQDKPPPLEEYHVVWDRNLFDVSRAAEAAVKREKIDVDKIAVASKDVGLKLIGTVVANDPKLNYAVIEMVRVGNQAIFRENERAESVLIKQIFRNNVIIVTSSGEQRLTTGETSAISTKTPQGEPQAIGGNIPEVPGAGAVDKEVTLEIPRSEIAGYLPGIGQMLKESNSAPTISDGNPDGFAVGRLRAHDLFFRMGLRTGDVIKEVNGEEIDSSDDVKSLVQRMASGGQFSVVIRRLGQVQQLNLSTN